MNYTAKVRERAERYGFDIIPEHAGPRKATARRSVINPAGANSSLAWSETRKNLVVAVPPSTPSELALQEFDLAEVELRPAVFGAVDPSALDFAQRMSVELTGKQL